MGNGKSNLIVRFTVYCLLTVFVLSVVNLQFKIKDLKEEKSNLEIQIRSVRDNIDEINLRLSTPFSDEYIERVAKERLNYRNPNEIIFYNDYMN